MSPNDSSRATRVETVRERFEAAWRSGQSPRIEDYIGKAVGADRAALLRALIAAELELSRSTGEQVSVKKYRKRFPDDAEAISSAFSESGQARATADTSVAKESVRTGHLEPHTEMALTVEADVPKNIGRFRVAGLLGEGAFGRVYRATDPQLGRDVAIKVPMPTVIENPNDRARFLREARAAASLHHPNICPVHEVGEENGLPYIVMGFVPGQSLAAVLKARKEPLAAKQAALVARKLAFALDAAHNKGIVHRDLKPANVMFDKERRDVVVTDFGLARMPRLGDAQTTREGAIMGTPAYMSPEQARGDTKAVGPASDQYALGVMLYEMLTGRRPFTGTVTEVLGKILHVEPESPASLRPNLDPELVGVCLKAMAKDSAARFATMRSFADALGKFATDTPSTRPAMPASSSAATAKETTDTQRIAEVFAFTEQAVEKAIRRHRTPTWMKVGIGVLILIGLAVPGLVFFARTPTAKVTIQIDVDVNDKSLTFFLDGKQIEREALTREIELKVGKHVLEVKKNSQVIRRYEFAVSKDAGPRIELKEDVPSTAPAIKDTIEFKVGNEIVARYNTAASASIPYLWPILAPGGVPVTRGWPMEPALPEPVGTKDHSHQRSVWFAPGEVIPEGIDLKGKQSVDFWSENPGHGTIVCVKNGGLRPTKNGAALSTWNEWRTADGVKILDEERTITFHDLPAGRLFVFECRLTASVCPITFGDTKEGAFGVRAHDALRAALATGGVVTAADGTSVKPPAMDPVPVWGQHSDWHDHSGSVDGMAVGVAVFDDPKNPSRATWNTRAYGLVAANPFSRDKSGFPAQKGKTDLVKIEKGKSLTFRYGVYAHSGDAKTGKVAEAYETFKDNDFVALFNGKVLSGWNVIRSRRPPQTPVVPAQGWTVQNGALHCVSSDFLWLRTEREYANFVLKLDFKLPAGGANTAVYLRNSANKTGLDGFHVQLVPDDPKWKPTWRAGGIWNVVEPKVAAMRPLGEWNHVEIQCDGAKVRVLLNDQVTVDLDVNDYPELKGCPRSGFIGLANFEGEGKGVAFRNIRIKELPTQTGPDVGFVSDFDSKDPTGWESTLPSSFSVDADRHILTAGNTSSSIQWITRQRRRRF